MSKKEKFALYLTPDKKALLERRYQEDGSRSLTAFIERAIDFYMGHREDDHEEQIQSGPAITM